LLSRRCYVRRLENRCSRARRASSITDPDTIDFERAAGTGDPIAMNSQTVLSDRALIIDARAGSRNAFGELVRRHSRLVFGMSLKMLRNREDAEDNLQNAFSKAYGKIQQFEGHSQFSTWLLPIAINEALMTLRKRGAGEVALRGDQDRAADDPQTKAELRDVHPDPERQYLVKELAAKALDALPHPLKHTFILQKKEGWTNRELAETLDIAPAGVKSRIFRARARLRQRILDLSKTEAIALQG
jgi:RNA polymerase sigma-70 factor (ECF subfamily)